MCIFESFARLTFTVNSILNFFQFRAQVQQMLKIPCSNGGKKGLEHCDKSQSFFNGINLMQSPGGEKSQTLSTNVVQSQSRVSGELIIFCIFNLLSVKTAFISNLHFVVLDW